MDNATQPAGHINMRDRALLDSTSYGCGGRWGRMNTLKTIQHCFPRTNLSHVQTKEPNSRRRRRSILCLSSADGSESSSSSSPNGDKQNQELLAQIAMLQAQKVRLTDFLDERSAHLAQFAEDANAEFDAIGEKAFKELDDAGDRIMEKLEVRMQDLEEKAEMNRQEVEEKEKVLEEFEEQMGRDRNEGLFFKGLGQKKPQQASWAKADAAQMVKLREQQVAKAKAGSKSRRNMYLAVMSLLILAMGNAVFAGPDVQWRTVAALGLMLIGLLAQFSYERSISLGADETNKDD